MAERLKLNLRWKDTFFEVGCEFDCDGDLYFTVEDDESTGHLYLTPSEAATLRDHLTEVLASGSIQ